MKRNGFSNLLQSISDLAQSRNKRFFGTLNHISEIISNAFKLIEEGRIDQFDGEIVESLISGSQESLQIMKSRPRVFRNHDIKSRHKLAKWITLSNPSIDFGEIDLEQDLSPHEYQTFKALKISRLLDIQHLAFRFCAALTLPSMNFMSFRTG